MNKLHTLFRRSFNLILWYFVIVVASFAIGLRLSAMNRQLSYYRKVMDDLELITLVSTEQEKSTEEILTEFKTADIRVANLKFFFRKYD